ncbi:MAG TPA: signal peptidase I, partial [Telluria sp.]|nr:signal peptidase I [Telluria sp.]
HLGEPARGDVVTFSSPKDGTRLIKRVIALPGDVVEMRDERLVINGRAANYALLEETAEPLAPGSVVAAQRFSETMGGERHSIQLIPELGLIARDFGPITIPKDQYLMLGDNRDNSADSRVIGLVPRKLLIGRAERVLVSADIKGNWKPRTERFGMRLE